MEKEPGSNWSLLHSIFYSLSFLSQRVEASTSPKCMGSEHTNVPLQPWSLSRSLYAVDPWRILDSLGQPGSVFVEIPSREHRLLLHVSHSMKANVSGTRS